MMEKLKKEFLRFILRLFVTKNFCYIAA